MDFDPRCNIFRAYSPNASKKIHSIADPEGRKRARTDAEKSSDTQDFEKIIDTKHNFSPKNSIFFLQKLQKTTKHYYRNLSTFDRYIIYRFDVTEINSGFQRFDNFQR